MVPLDQQVALGLLLNLVEQQKPHGHQGPSFGSRRHPRQFPFHLYVSSAVCMTSQNVLLSLDLI